MNKYMLLYRTKSGLKRTKVIKANDASEACMKAVKFCSKFGRKLYAMD